MALITLRQVKGTPLTIAELDNNFSNINLELTTNLDASAIARGTIANARTTAVSANSADSIVLRDASGNFSAGQITASLLGNATSATTANTLTTARTIAISGGATGTATSFNGGANISIPVTALNASLLSTGTVPGDRGVTAGSAISSFVEYNGTTKTAGQFYGGTTNPTLTTRLNYDGELYVTTLVEPSDINLKKDIEVIENALDKVSGISGYTYTMKETGERKTGLIAQELQSVLPEAVFGDEDGLSVAYGNVVGLLVEAIKELKAEVAELKTK